jgi:Zn-finger nucleic acid-binding protein
VLDRNVAFVGCTACYGLSATEDDLAVYVGRASGAKEAADGFKQLLETALGGSLRKARRECWSCGEAMYRFGFGESPFVILDRCSRHGVWLDRSELKKVVRASRAYAAAEGWIPPFDDSDDDYGDDD